MSKFLRFLVVLFALPISALATPAEDDPPGRVGRLGYISGEVTFRDSYNDDAQAAQLNWPVTSDNVIATGRRGRAEISVGSTAIRLDGDSELEFARLDDERIKLRLLVGSVALRVKSRDQAADFELTTPQGRVLLLEPGRYRIDSGLVRDLTAVAVFQGAARFDSADGSTTVNSGKRLEASGTDSPTLLVREARRDEFDDWARARERREDASRSVRYVSPEMTGYEDLDQYGVWRESDDYGAVWVPREVPSDWAPYRTGRWAWIDPWGWTWVDDMPWGFAPFHYGRWVLIGDSWAWAPGRVVARPVYAPALVAWVGQPGWSVSLGVGSAAAVGWFPLAPREVYYPAYKCSHNYVRDVNVTHVTNVTQIVSVQKVDVTKVNYHYRHVERAVTVVPATVVAASRPVAREVVHVRDRKLIEGLPVAVTAPAVVPLRHRDRGERETSERRLEERRTRPVAPPVGATGSPAERAQNAPPSQIPAAGAPPGPRRELEPQRREAGAPAVASPQPRRGLTKSEDETRRAEPLRPQTATEQQHNSRGAPGPAEAARQRDRPGVGAGREPRGDVERRVLRDVPPRAVVAPPAPPAASAPPRLQREERDMRRAESRIRPDAEPASVPRPRIQSAPQPPAPEPRGAVAPRVETRVPALQRGPRGEVPQRAERSGRGGEQSQGSAEPKKRIDPRRQAPESGER